MKKIALFVFALMLVLVAGSVYANRGSCYSSGSEEQGTAQVSSGSTMSADEQGMADDMATDEGTEQKTV